MRHVDLCSGIGGFALGFQWAGLSKPVLFCDIEPWSRRVLKKHWPDVPIAEDVKELSNDPERLVPDCDILTAGYPCQPFSVAGQRRGAEDDRHIWPEIFTIIKAKRPTWCVFENVYGHVSMGLDQVLSDLEAIGYSTQAFVVPACGVGAPHRRNRVWIIAHSNSHSEPDGSQHEQWLDVGNAQHDGSPSTAIRGKHKEDASGASKGKKASKQSERTGERGDTGNVADTDSNDGRHWSGTKSQEWQARVEHGRGGKRQPVGQPDENVADTDSKPSKVRGQHQTDATESLRRGGDARGSRGNDRGEFGASPNDEDVADTKGQHRDDRQHRKRGKATTKSGVRGQAGASGESVADWTRWWEFEPPVGRVADGIPRRVDRLTGLGNAIVPQIAQQIGEVIKKVEQGCIDA